MNCSCCVLCFVLLSWIWYHKDKTKLLRTADMVGFGEVGYVRTGQKKHRNFTSEKSHHRINQISQTTHCASHQVHPVHLVIKKIISCNSCHWIMNVNNKRMSSNDTNDTNNSWYSCYPLAIKETTNDTNNSWNSCHWMIKVNRLRKLHRKLNPWNQWNPLTIKEKFAEVYLFFINWLAFVMLS